MRTQAGLFVLTLFSLTGCTGYGESSTADSTANAAAQTPDGAWIIGSRMLSAPDGGSDALRSSISKTAQPDIAGHIAASPTTLEEWAQSIAAANARTAQKAQTLAERWSVTITEGEIAGIPVYSVEPAEVDLANSGRLFIAVHPGAYLYGGGPASAAEAVMIAHYARIRVVSIDYRMPPDHPFPAAVDDVVTVWRSLLADRPSKSMALGGTSAGGGLALAATLRIIELGLEPPGALWAGSPWADLTKTGDSQFTNDGIDRVLVSYSGLLEGAAELYADGHHLKTPLISPVYGDFTGFPPTDLVTGTRDLFLSDVVRVHRKMRSAGVTADLNVYEGTSHADYYLFTELPESDQVYRALGAFLLRHLR